MPDKAINKEQKFRVIIYHGHLHKIPIDDEKKEIQENELITAEE
jgi:predicted phosphodiesterase